MTILLSVLASAPALAPAAAPGPRADAEFAAFAAAIEPASLAPVAVPSDDFPEMEYTYAEASYVWTDSDLIDDEVDGWEATGSIELPLNFFLQGTYRDQSGDADLTTTRIGGGWHFGFTSRLDAYGILSYERLEVESSGDDDTDDGVGGEIGLRLLLTHRLEVNGRTTWADVGDSDAGIGFGARWYFTDFLSVGARFDAVGDDELLAAGVRFEL